MTPIKKAPKFAKYLGYFCEEISRHDLSKRAQTFHTAWVKSTATEKSFSVKMGSNRANDPVSHEESD